jgi:flagellar assembly factor FliW
MTVNTFRFGPLEVPEDKLITMERPILGFENFTDFCLIEIEELAPFMWLQSTEDENVAFMVVNPVVFFPDYRIVVNPKEIAELKVDRVEAVETYVIVTIHESNHEISANLQGPILINTETRLAKQLVLVNSEYRVDHRILEALESRSGEEEPELVEAMI